MGVAALHDICQGLLDEGMEPEMPAAILQKGTTAGQKKIVATVSTLEAEVKRQGIQTPAIIVVGKVCALADEFNWYEKLPLMGWKVLVTRPKNRSSRTTELLREKGAEVLELPSIRTQALEDQTALYQALNHISDYQWAVFTSPTGAEIFLDELKRRRMDIRSLAGIRLAAIGQGTRKILEDRGLLTDLMPEIYDGDCLGETLAKELKAESGS